MDYVCKYPKGYNFYHDPEYIRKQRKAKLGNKNPSWKGGNPVSRVRKYPVGCNFYKDPEYISKLRESKIGHTHGFQKGNTINCGKNHPMYGKKIPKKTLEKRRIANLGEKNPNWQGGITPLYRRIHNLSEYKKWRSNVFERDNWTCQTCGVRSKAGKAVSLEAHHIKKFSQIVKEDEIGNVWEAQMCKELWEVSNGVTLCKDCHILTRKVVEK